MKFSLTVLILGSRSMVALPLNEVTRSNPSTRGSANYGPRAGSRTPSKIIRPAAPLQIVITAWPT